MKKLPATELDFAVRGKVSVWVGDFNSQDALLQYVESETGFGSDFGCVLIYRRELAVEPRPKPVRELLRGCSWSHQFADEIAARVTQDVYARCAVVCYAADYSLLGITPAPKARLTFLGVAAFGDRQ